MDKTISDSFENKLLRRAEKINLWLDEAFRKRTIPARLENAMTYSLQAGGKRLRPVLCLSCAALCGKNEEEVLPFAGALEMIHTYSLIHDDLPAMDDDDIRRGRPSNHIAFDEATAILAGDGLLSDAFLMMCACQCESSALLCAIQELAMAIGSSGMVGGQELDMIYTGQKNISLDQIKKMQFMKTGMFISASCKCGAILAQADSGKLSAISNFGNAIGAAFQIVDDILDLISDTKTLGKPAGTDLKSEKNTFPSIVGLEKSKKLARDLVCSAKQSISDFRNDERKFLNNLADFIIMRTA